MALIKCPECGKEVSSAASACPVCGYPIATNNPCGTVAIKIDNGLAGTVRVHNMVNDAILWQGKAGQVARFEVDGPTRIGLSWGISWGKIPKEYQITVQARERYEFVWQKGFFMNSLVFNRIDTIDSD